MLPHNPIVSELKMERSMEMPVLISEALPKPVDPAPARNESRPLNSWLLGEESPIEAMEALEELSSTARRIGRLAEERSTHFQSSWSAGLWAGATLIASNNVLSVRLRTILPPARKPTPSRKDGRYAVAETLMS